MKKRMWKREEDIILKTYVEMHGEGKWSAVSRKLGLRRGAKSCRLRWRNYLRPDIKHGSMSKDEEDLIIRMHKLIGNRWALIAGRLPGRTDNEVKNYWNTYLSKKVPTTHRVNRNSNNRIANQQEQTHQIDKEPTKIGNEQSSQQELKKNQINVVELIKQDNMFINTNTDSKALDDDDQYWSSTITGELVVGPGSDAGSLRCGVMDMLLMDGGDPFMTLGAWDSGSHVLFDTFGSNWDDALPFAMNYS